MSDTSDFEMINPSSEDEQRCDWEEEIHLSDDKMSDSDCAVDNEEFEYVMFDRLPRTGSVPDLHVIKFSQLRRRNSCPSEIHYPLSEDMNNWVEEQEQLLNKWADSCDEDCETSSHWSTTSESSSESSSESEEDKDSIIAHDDGERDYELSYPAHEYDDPQKYYEEYDRWRNYYDAYWQDYSKNYNQYYNNYYHSTYDNIDYRQPNEINWDYYSWQQPTTSTWGGSDPVEWTDYQRASDWNTQWESQWQQWNTSNDEDWANNNWDQNEAWYTSKGDIAEQKVEYIPQEHYTTSDCLLDKSERGVIEEFELEEPEREESNFDIFKKNVKNICNKVVEVCSAVIDVIRDSVSIMWDNFCDLF